MKKVIVIRIDRNLHQKLSFMAVANGVTRKALVESLIDNAWDGWQIQADEINVMPESGSDTQDDKGE